MQTTLYIITLHINYIICSDICFKASFFLPLEELVEPYQSHMERRWPIPREIRSIISRTRQMGAGHFETKMPTISAFWTWSKET